MPKSREYEWCYTYEPDKECSCLGASGRKLKCVCVYCPNWTQYRKNREKERNDNGNGNERKDNY